MRWYVGKEKGQFVIRGWPGNKRLAIAKYRRIRQDEAALEELVKRLNAPVDTKKKVEFKHAFISPALLDEYLRYLKAQIPSESGANQEFSSLKRHFLNYFIGQLDLMNPLDWHRVHETQWAEYLMSDKAPKAAKTKRDIVIAANRFMKWMHKQRPEEVPPLEFLPLSKAKYREIEAKRELKNEIKERSAIPDADLAKIKKACPEEIAAYVRLAESYGLRRSESLALKPDAVRKGYLRISSQLERVGVLRPLKGREQREVPHWFSTAAQAYKWIEQAQAFPMNPSTLTHKWAELMLELKLSYDFHDLRHTFITKAIRKHLARDVQLAAGHKDIRTTMRYAHDDRTMDDEPFKPEAA
jgi:integrase